MVTPLRRALLGIYVAATIFGGFYISPFIGLLVIRYLRLVTHLLVNLLHRPAASARDHAPFPRREFSVIVPTVDPTHPGLVQTLESILANRPGQLIVVTVGEGLLRELRDAVARAGLDRRFPHTEICLGATHAANKRHQVCHGFRRVRGAVTVLADDSVVWGGEDFLDCAGAPFSDAGVGIVGTIKHVFRDPALRGLPAVFNMLGSAYLERHNFEMAATNALDSGVFVVSGRTMLLRSSILREPDFMRGYLNEFFLSRFGPLNADDDNYITRYAVQRGYRIRFQTAERAAMRTFVGRPDRFLQQCQRWARTTFRSNPVLLHDPAAWLAQPWTSFNLLCMMFNAALLLDGLLVWSLRGTAAYRSHPAPSILALAAVVLASKWAKFRLHLRQHPRDWSMFPAYVAFGYFHSLVKLWALLTFWEVRWSGRELGPIGGGGPSFRGPIPWIDTIGNGKQSDAERSPTPQCGSSIEHDFFRAPKPQTARKLANGVIRAENLGTESVEGGIRNEMPGVGWGWGVKG